MTRAATLVLLPGAASAQWYERGPPHHHHHHAYGYGHGDRHGYERHHHHGYDRPTHFDRTTTITITGTDAETAGGRGLTFPPWEAASGAG